MTIKDLRTAAGMTQKAFAEYFGIPKRTIEDWDGGHHAPPQYLIDLMEHKLTSDGIIQKTDKK